MLTNNNILEDFNLVEDLDDESAALYSGGLSGDWQLKSIGGKPVLSDKKITISFKDGQISGRGFCNYYFASYETKGKIGGVGDLQVGLIGTTRMACKESLMKQDVEYFNALKETNSYIIPFDLLILSGERKNLVYEPLV
jgi:heat shock protein HslJ